MVLVRELETELKLPLFASLNSLRKRNQGVLLPESSTGVPFRDSTLVRSSLAPLKLTGGSRSGTIFGGW
jgi:hypothetical protein